MRIVFSLSWPLLTGAFVLPRATTQSKCTLRVAHGALITEACPAQAFPALPRATQSPAHRGNGLTSRASAKLVEMIAPPLVHLDPLRPVGCQDAGSANIPGSGAPKRVIDSTG